MKIVTRQEAKALGLTRYFSGSECKQGHISERKTHNGECLECVRVYRESNKDKAHEYYLKNLKHLREQNQKNYLNNSQDRKLKQKEYRKNNPGKVNACNSARRAKKVSSCNWADQEKIKAIYLKLDDTNKTSDIVYNVDHIVPINSDFVCGLHNEFNLEIITAEENQRKGNRYWPNMTDIDDLELRLLVKQFKSS